MEEHPYDVAVIGMSGKFPKANSIDELWENLKSGKDCITRDSAFDKPNYISAYGKVDDIELFDADFFNFTRKEALDSDPQQRLLMECIYHALENSGYNSMKYHKDIGLFVSCDEHVYVWNYLLQQQGNWFDNYQTAKIYCDGTFTTKIAYKFDFHGSAILSKYACASSLGAIHLAYQALVNYECDMAVTGGVSIEPEQKGYYCYDATVSRSGYTRTFDANADGLVPGCAEGILILKRLDDAINDHDNILAVLKSTFANHDGSRKAGFPAPSVQGQEEAIRAVIDLANLSPNDIDYFETHGTATILGDSVELRTLKNVFSQNDKPVKIGSIKPNIGHTNVASGVCNVIKDVLMLHNHTLVPIIHFENPNDELLEDDCKLEVQTITETWQGSDNHLLTTGASAFGMGGGNVIAILQEYRQPPRKVYEPSNQLFVVSGKTREALTNNCNNLAKFLEGNSSTQLRDVAYTLQTGRGEFNYRWSCVTDSISTLIDSLKSVEDRQIVPISTSRKNVAFVVAGSGSQGNSIGKELYHQNETFKNFINKAFKTVKEVSNIDLSEWFFNYPNNKEEFAKQTTVGTLLTFTISCGIAKLWESLGVVPDVLIGHSLGEYVCAYIAKMLTFSEIVMLLTERGKLMESVPEGRMVSVSYPLEKLIPLLVDGVQIGAINAKNRIMVSGLVDDIERFIKVLKAEKISFSVLPVCRAGHSESFRVIYDQYMKVLNRVKFKRSKVKIVSTLTGDLDKAHAMETPKYWADQMCSTVNFMGAIESISNGKDRFYLEIGTSDQMTTFVRKVIRDNKGSKASSSIAENQVGNSYIGLLNTTAKLWHYGVNINWENLYDTLPYKTPLPMYAFDHKTYWKYRPIVNDDSAIHTMDDATTIDGKSTNVVKATTIDTTSNSLDDITNALVNIFKEVLDVDNINPNENIFDLGFDSFSTIQVVQKVEAILNKRISLKQIYNFDTIMDIAKFLERQDESTETQKSESINRPKQDLDDLFSNI